MAKLHQDTSLKVHRHFNKFFRYLVSEAEENVKLREENIRLEPLGEVNVLLYKQNDEKDETIDSLRERLDKWQNYSIALGQALVDAMAQGYKPEEDSMAFLIEMGLLTKTGRVPKTRKKKTQ